MRRVMAAIVRGAVVLAITVGAAVLLAGIVRAKASGRQLATENVPPSRDVGAVLSQLDRDHGGARVVKPRADDLKAYAADHPGRWLVGRCDGPYATEAEAADSARADAARAVEVMMRRERR